MTKALLAAAFVIAATTASFAQFYEGPITNYGYYNPGYGAYGPRYYGYAPHYGSWYDYEQAAPYFVR